MEHGDGPTPDPANSHKSPQVTLPTQLTFHVFLNVVHQGLDGVGQVPGVLLDADLDQAPATDRTVFLLFELWGRRAA